jgi:hypothetical protein
MAEREVELVEGAEEFAIALNCQELGHLESASITHKKLKLA